MFDLGDWLSGLGLERYLRAFVENDIDRALLPTLTNEDLLALGVQSLGHRKRLLDAIAALDGPAAMGELARTVRHRPAPEPNATRSLGAELSRSLPATLRVALEARGYELEDVLGRGGMGEVFLARQTSVDREVAIKTLHVRDDPDGAARFMREARAIAALRHPHSVRLYDYVTTDDRAACIVMEHVRGESLWTALRRERRFPLERIVPILVQICGALAEAHAMGIVHRDLKPGNILLQEVDGYRDFARVLDFGLARWAATEESRLTRTGHVFGTPRYLSPEQVQGTEVTPRSDLYSLGVLLYEALAGEPPFAGDIDASLMFKHLKESAPTLPSDVSRPPSVDRLLEKLLAKAPALRPPSATALREELAGLLDRRPAEVTSMPPPAPDATERRQVVALDVAFFDPARIAELEDDAAHALIRRCHALVDAVARRRGGFRNARTPHGTVLVFGAPVARRDDVARALDAALDIRTQLASQSTREPAIACRIGVADGRAIAGGTDARDGEGYFVSGGPLDEAARLGASALPGEVRITASLAERASPSFASWASEPSTGEAILSGRETEETEASRVPFVGRSAELDRLVGLLEECRAPTTRPRGQIVIVAGEAGIGKSRLIERLHAEARKRGVRCAKGLVFDTDVARQKDAIHQIVGTLLDLPEEGDRAAALEQRIGPSALRAEQWPFLYHFLEMPLPGPMQRLYDAMDPGARLGGYRDMLAALLASETREEPLLLLLEDVHWASGAVLDAIETLCTLSSSLRMLLVLTTRVEGEERWRHALVGHSSTRIELEPLGAADARELALRLGVTQSSQMAAVVERAGGHPLLLTELARSDRNAGDALPHSVEGLVHARVDRLPDADRTAIQIGAVLGARFDLATLRDVLGEPEYDCGLLVDYRLVRRDAEGTFMFTHALVRDAVYGSLVEERRRALHERCADRMRDDRELAATHLERACSPRAAAAYLDAATRAIAAHRIETARGLLVRGLGLAAAGSNERSGLIERLAHVELLLGNAIASIDAHRELVELAEDDVARYHAYVGLAAALRVASRYPDALTALDEAERSAERADIPTAQVHHLRGNVCFSTGDLARCQSSHERALAIATEVGDPELRAKALSGLADAHYGQGRLVSAARTWEECIDLARSQGLLGIEAANLAMLAIASVFLDDPARATVLASQAIELTQRLARKRDEALARGAASLAALARGDFEDALAHGEQALVITRAIGTVVFEETGHYYVAQALLGLGRRNDAKRHVDQGLALCREHGMYFVGAALLGTFARLCWTDSERTAALDEGERVLAERSLSFNRFWFHENAIAASLAAGDRARAQRHAEALDRATSAERVPSIERVRGSVPKSAQYA